jgi:hypothetical protein
MSAFPKMGSDPIDESYVKSKQERWQQLAEAAATEESPEKLKALVDDLLRELEGQPVGNGRRLRPKSTARLT